MSKKILVILSGCGVFDGAEIQEAVISLLELRRRGYEITMAAPDIEQAHVINHIKGDPVEGESRNVLIEASRIARGQIKNLADVSEADFDGLYFPGGFGAAKNLSTFAFDGAKMQVNETVESLIRDFHTAGKPICFLCISPTIGAKVISSGVELTIGENKDVSLAMEQMGASHIDLPVEKAHVDAEHKIVSAPAYMYDDDILKIESSIKSAVEGFAGLLESN